MASKYIYNNSQSTVTYVGVPIPSDTYYEIPETKLATYQSNQTVLSDILSGTIQMSRDGSTVISNAVQGLNFLKSIGDTDSDGYQKIRVRSFADTDGLRFRGKGITTTIPVGTTGYAEYSPTEDQYVNGVELIVENQVSSDYVKFQVVDKDGIAYPSGTVLDEFASDWQITTDSQRQGPYILPYPALVYSWMYVRVVYVSTGSGSDPVLKANLFMHRKPT